jgi:hypothetical protein
LTSKDGKLTFSRVIKILKLTEEFSSTLGVVSAVRGADGNEADEVSLPKEDSNFCFKLEVRKYALIKGIPNSIALLIIYVHYIEFTYVYYHLITYISCDQ